MMLVSTLVLHVHDFTAKDINLGRKMNASNINDVWKILWEIDGHRQVQWIFFCMVKYL